MSLQIEATYEDGALKLDRPLALQDKERVLVTTETKTSHAKASYGLIAWAGSVQELDEVLDPENHPWATPV